MTISEQIIQADTPEKARAVIEVILTEDRQNIVRAIKNCRYHMKDRSRGLSLAKRRAER